MKVLLERLKPRTKKGIALKIQELENEICKEIARLKREDLTKAGRITAKAMHDRHQRERNFYCRWLGYSVRPFETA